MDHTNREMTGVTLYVPSLQMGTEVALNGTGVRGSVGSVHSMPSVMMYALAGFRNFQFHEQDLGYRGRWEGVDGNMNGQTSCVRWSSKDTPGFEQVEVGYTMG
jgi:hypothetical protein